MLWFSHIEYVARDGTSTQRQLVPVREWDAFAAALPQTASARCALLLQRIIASRNALQMGAHIIRLDAPQVMAIINATPDSFSDGGKNLDPEIATEAAAAMLRAGASIIDIGGKLPQI
jgi:dihydropteroate synthase